MGKKEALLISAVFVFVMSTVVASAVADVAYVYRKSYKVDNNIVDEFNNLGLSVDLINEASLPIDFSGYKMIFAGDEIFTNAHLIPVNDHPSVIVNYYHTDTWGFTDNDGASQLAANEPLDVLKDGFMIQVYTAARVSPGGAAIPYYFLDMEDKAPSLETIALTEMTQSGDDFGDVISVAEPGDLLANGVTQNAKACFFGIVMSDFWTPAAKDMFDECVGFVVSSCQIDSDCPDSTLTDEPFCHFGDVYQNERSFSCQNGGFDAQCVSADDAVLIEECDFGCSNGACIVPSCVEDSDCGVDGFVGGEFCSEGDVERTFKTFTCNNPGTEDSFCSNHSEDVLIEECSGDCVGGQCVDVACNFNSDCDDSNSLTLDECLHPGEAISECRNTPINCNVDNDCGSTGFVGGEFCSDDDIAKNFQTATCFNGGTTDSFCQIDVNENIVTMCDFACSDASCVRCDESLDCDDGNPATADSCVNPGTAESFCSNQGASCSDDSDCGVDGFVGGEFCSEGDVAREFMSWTCNNPGMPGSFCSSDIEEVVVEQCSDSCAAGECVGVTCSNDLDCGVDGFIGSGFCSEGDVFKTFETFTCNNPGLPSSFCSSDTSEQLVQECAELCVNGMCEGTTCNQDSDCDDSNPLTFDECLNPGTVVSECRNTPVNCNANSDCGFTGFIGQEFCSQDDVAKNYQTATCNNPGTTNSFCDISVVSQVVEMCDFACSEATCIRCDNNLDCDDGELDTIDLCNNPGTVESFCSNEDSTPPEIACNQDSDCGETTAISQNFCSANEVRNLVMSWTCNNPGLTTSYCSSGISQETTEVCSEFCSEGECVEIECFNHSDCDDSDDLTLDICNNPGSAESFCTNTPVDITCFQDSDCGIDGQVGGDICVGDEVTNLFLEFTCNAPGTPQSFCSSALLQETTEVCEFVCSGGQCVDEPAECGNGIVEQGEECDDGNLISGDGCSATCEDDTECTPGETRDCGVSDIGICEFGTETCGQDGFFGECIGDIGPADEVCDEFDNDCDGATDEGGVCEPVCEDECTLSARECLSDDSYRVCADFNGDGCTEWSLAAECGFGLECSGGQCIPL